MANQSNSSTAVLLFNYSEKQKASLKKIAPRISAKNLEGLINQLNKRAKKVCKKSRLPFFQFNATTKDNFAEQLYVAYQELFKQGFSNVIGISNDCPSFQETDLAKTVAAFDNNEIVLGPAKDGGLYLFGIKKSSFTKEEFLAFNWQSAELSNDIRFLVNKKKLSSISLASKADMDTVAEFQSAFRSHFNFLNTFKSQLFSFCKRQFRIHSLIESNRLVLNFSLRAPPHL